MLALHGQAAARTPQEQTAVEPSDRGNGPGLDQLVYELYGLTDEEIRIVEESIAAAAK